MSDFNKIKIHIAPELQQFLPRYIVKRQEDLHLLKEHIEKQEYEAIAMVSHKTVGHAKNYGMPELGDICRQMETAAQEKDLTKIQNLVDQYEIYLKRIELPDQSAPETH